MVIIQFSIGFIFLGLFLYSLLKYFHSMATYFTMTSLLISIYSFGYGLELLMPTTELISFAILIELSALVFIPAFWLLITYKVYFNRTSSLPINLLIFLIPVLSLFISLTNSYHHLYYTSIEIVYHKGLSIAILGKGPWYFVFVTYSFVSLLIGFIVFFKLWRKSQYDLKNEAFWMLIASIFPYLTYWTYALKLFPVPYDLTTIGFSFLAFFYYMAIIKYDLLEIKDIVWDKVFNEIKEGIIVVDSQQRLLDYNPAAQSFFNWLIQDHLGSDMRNFETGRKIYDQSVEKFTLETIHHNTKIYLGFRMYSLIENGQMVGNIYIFQDVTHDMETLVDLLEKANYDALSGVFNKYKLIEEAQKAFYVADKNKTDLSVLMIDIDLFKEINDTFGHLAGDHAIQALTTIFKQICCPIDIIGRYGGEEFLILLPNTPHQKAIGIAESLRSMVEQKNFCYEDKEIHFTISVGVTTMTGRSKAVTLLSLISKADEALYQAKHLGRNRVAYSPLDE